MPLSMPSPFRLPLATATALLAWCLPAQAQWEVRAELTHLAEADFGDARLEGREHALFLGFPAADRGPTWWRLALDYRYTRYEYTALPSRNRDLHRLGLLLEGGDADGFLGWRLAPTVATSSNVFKDLWDRGGRRDVDLYGTLWTHLGQTAAQGWRLGLTRDDAFGKPRLYPELGWRFEHGGMAGELGWPRSRVGWALGEEARIGLGIAPYGARWHVVSDERDGARFHYRQQAWRGGAWFDWEASPGWRLDGEAGVEFDRRHRFEDDTGAFVDRHPENAAYLRLGVRWRR